MQKKKTVWILTLHRRQKLTQNGERSKFKMQNYKNTENPKVRAAYGKLSGVVGIILNVMLFIKIT